MANAIGRVNFMSDAKKSKRVTVDWSMWDGQSTDIVLQKALAGGSVATAGNLRHSASSRPAKGAVEKRIHITISKYCC